MKNRVLIELLKDTNAPALLLDKNEPEWHNARFAELTGDTRETLLSWSLAQKDSSHRLLCGIRFELLVAGRHRVLIGLPEIDRPLQRQLLRSLLPALNAGGRTVPGPKTSSGDV